MTRISGVQGKRSDPSRLRIEELIGRSFRVLLLACLALGLPFVFSYRSAGATWGSYSSRYLFGVVLPVTLATLVVLLGTVAWGAFTRIASRCLGWVPLPAAVTAAAFAGGAGLVYALTVSDEYVSVLLLILLPCLVVFVWSAARGGAEAPLAAIPLLLFGILLFGVETSATTGGALVVWGDDSTFATLFPKEPPFIGEGGRLKPGLDVRMRAPEYREGAGLVTNESGFRNSDNFTRVPDAGEVRVLSLGDSFSTGFCADQSAFFGTLLEQGLEKLFPGRRVRVMNAEVSDPAYGLYYLQKYGMEWHPDLVIYGLSGNDVMQADQFYGPGRLFRLTGAGLLERNQGFDPSLPAAWERYDDFVYPVVGEPSSVLPSLAGSLMTKMIRFRLFAGLTERALEGASGPVPVPGYADAYEAADGHKRLVDGGANLAFFYEPGGGPVESMYSAFFDLLAGLQRTASEGGAGFLLVLHPFRYQVQPRDWEAMKQKWNLDEGDFDLSLWNRRIDTFAGDEGIQVCDLNGAFAIAAAGENLYLPGGDTHYNRRGHEVAAEAAARCIAGSAPTF